MALTDNLVSRWRLWTNYTDSVWWYNWTESWDVTENTTTSWTWAPSWTFPKCTNFWGSSDYVTTTYTTALWTWDFSFSFRVYFSSLWTDDTIVTKNITTTWWYMAITLEGSDSSKLDFVTATSSASSRVTTATWAISSWQWYHIVCTRWSSWTVMKTYINNGSPTSATVTARNMTTTTGIVFWRNHATQCLNWNICWVWFWTRELTSSEVSELYNSWAGLDYPFTSVATFTPVIAQF